MLKMFTLRFLSCFISLAAIFITTSCGGNSNKSSSTSSVTTNNSIVSNSFSAVSSSVNVSSASSISSRSLSSGLYFMGGGIQGAPLKIPANVTTVAGGPPAVAVDGILSVARFSQQMHGTVGDGVNLYVVDGNSIRKIEKATGIVSTFAGSTYVSDRIDGNGTLARFRGPMGITCDGANLYVTDTHTIRKIIIATGEVSTFVGLEGSFGPDGAQGSSDGVGANAGFSFPSGITTDGANLYVVDSHNHTIRKVVISTKEVTTLAGTAGVDGRSDGIGANASFSYPSGIAIDGANLYVTDSNNHSIRKIVIATKVVTTIAGSPGVRGTSDGVGPSAQFNNPKGITTDGINLYVSDRLNNTIRKILISSGEVFTLAGTPEAGHADGVGVLASFAGPDDIFIEGNILYITDSGNTTLRQIELSKVLVSSLAGHVNNDGYFNGPGDVTTDGTNLFVTGGSDFGNSLIQKVSIDTGKVSLLSYFPRDNRRYNLQGITANEAGIFVAFPRCIEGPDATYGNCYDLTGKFQDGFGEAVGFRNATKVTNDGKNLYVVDSLTIRKIDLATSEVTTLAGAVDSGGTADGAAEDARFAKVTSLTTDGIYLYVVDNNAIRKVVIATGAVSTLAGTKGGAPGADDGVGASASFSNPSGITTDGTNLYVSDFGNKTIRKVVIESGEVSTIAGAAGLRGKDDGEALSARFSYPFGIVSDGRALFVTDMQTVRKIE